MTRFALILGLLLCLTVPAAGQKGDLQRQIAEKQRAIDALEKQIARGEQELTSIKKGKNSEQQSVRRLSRQIASRRQLLDEPKASCRCSPNNSPRATARPARSTSGWNATAPNMRRWYAKPTATTSRTAT